MADDPLKKGRYTNYTNRIGLFSNSKGSFIKNDSDIVLNFPFKDTVLEAGMNKEDVARDERFLHVEIDSKDIDTLEEPKVLTNFIYIDKDGERTLEADSDIEFFDESGELKQNLLIKGNNLLALYTLRERLAGRVKMIYIDPPFNTQTDASTFAYNNAFNHSSWLVFMKNRMEVAKEMLTEDGIFCVAIDHHELFYLGVLADEIFGRENRLGVIAVVHNPGGRQDEKFFPTAHENMIIYARDISKARIKNLSVNDKKLMEYKYEDEFGKYKLRDFRRSGNNSLRTERPGLYYPLYIDNKTLEVVDEPGQGIATIYPIDSQGVERCWRWSKSTMNERKDKYLLVKKNHDSIVIYIKERESDYEGERPKTVWNRPEYTGQTATNEIKKDLGEKAFSYPKSPFLMKDIVSITTDDSDIILDFFGGSGTTALAVMANNLEDGGNRKFIIVEQMDYVNTVTFKRLENAINKYNNNFSFVYLELKKYNQEYVERILTASSKGELDEVYEDMAKNAFLKFWFDKKEFEKDENFRSLDLEKRKKLLVDILDENQLYLNYLDMEDKKYHVTHDEKILTNKFYGKRED